ncbi:MAG: hypothetical protein EA361_11305 [Bacteroidetes bacterium]|nr:MAG: hypothetical protein EA361_11305 [Bacteroidota bacterium]
MELQKKSMEDQREIVTDYEQLCSLYNRENHNEFKIEISKLVKRKEVETYIQACHEGMESLCVRIVLQDES